MSELEWTHKGWFGLCPVYIAELDTDEPFIEPRHWLFEPLMFISHYGFVSLIFLISLVDPEYEPNWPIRITGELGDGS